MASKSTPLMLATALAALTFTSCGTVKITKEPFGKTADGTAVDIYQLSNKSGMVAKITNYGGTITELHVPDADGNLADVVLGYDTLGSYIKASPYFGCITGRFANRIAKGRFTLGGTVYKLATNNSPNHLHGGDVGFDKRVWDAREVSSLGRGGVEFSYRSPDGEEGYPGNLDTTVTYWLTSNNELQIEYRSKTDKATPVNLTHHSYINLGGAGSGDILGHQVELFASKYISTDSGGIPLPNMEPVKGTPFDFLQPHAIGERIDAAHPQIAAGKGYDHTWVIDGKGMRLAARVTEPKSGRIMEVLTDQPGIQFYTGNYLDGSNRGKDGKVYRYRNGLCLETQVFPDSPNRPDFPNSILEPGETYKHTCIYRFKTK